MIERKTDTDRVRPRAGLRLLLIALASVLVSCAEAEQMEVLELPPTPALMMDTRWAVITSSHLRLRESPTVESRAVTTLWRGNVVEVLSRKGGRDEVEGKSDYWYQISYGGLQGWVFGAHISLHDAKEQAERSSRELNR